MNRFVPITVLFALTLGGCGGSGSVDLCVRQGELYCDFLWDCCTDLERAVLLGLDSRPRFGSIDSGDLTEGMMVGLGDTSSVSECQDTVAQGCENDMTYAAAAEEEERIEIDEEAMDKCFEPFEEAADACDADKLINLFDNRPLECDGILIGKLNAGEECYRSYECSPAGSICEEDEQPNPDVFTEDLTGVCVAAASNGQSCEDVECAEGLICLPDPNAGENRCFGFQQAGQSCSEPTEFCDPRPELICDNDTCVVDPNRRIYVYNYCKDE